MPYLPRNPLSGGNDASHAANLVSLFLRGVLSDMAWLAGS